MKPPIPGGIRARGGADGERAMFNCRDSIHQLLHFLEGDLPEGEEERIEAHLAECPPCVEFIRSYRKTAGLCRQHLVAKMPPELAAKMKEYLLRKLAPKK